MTLFSISIVSDTACLWCWMGSRRLQKAISLYQKTYPGSSKDTFEITWKPYYLDPNALTKGWPMKEKILNQMTPEQVERAQKHMQAVATVDGISIKCPGVGGKTGNTKLSHMLLHVAKEHSLDMQSRVAEEIYRRRFEQEGDITDVEMLIRAGVDAGLDENALRKALEDPEVAKVVDSGETEVKSSGVTGVPQFIFQGGGHRINGAGDPMDFFELFMKIKEEESR
ncbi:thioredoxin-like protein [Tothia fuscella]|uniref:Thioredoxin-like protein n=1 Tax=Tothia fuscella TaxID=1048955 RepID=A0A9P4P4X3_9PEZI|nr:thioredoxin-like protein [Tothia fuscella]